MNGEIIKSAYQRWKEGRHLINLGCRLDPETKQPISPVYGLAPLGFYTDNNGNQIIPPEEIIKSQIYLDADGKPIKEIVITKNETGAIQVSFPRLEKPSIHIPPEQTAPMPMTGGFVPICGGNLIDYDLNDAGNVERVLSVVGDNLRFIKEPKRWRRWDGKHWTKTDKWAVKKACAEVMQSYYAEAKISGISKVEYHAKESCNESGLYHLLGLLEAVTGISLEEIPRSTNLLCVKNGVVNLITGRIHQHEVYKYNYFFYCVDANYIPNAFSQPWNNFLNEISLGDGAGEKTIYLNKAFGYGLIGDPKEQLMFILVGIGANGKSTLLTIFKNLLGNALVTRVPIGVLTSRGATRSAQSATPELAKLEGKRFAITSEASERDHLSEAQFKAIVGSYEITARQLYGESRDFSAEFTFYMDTNRLPKLNEGGLSVFRRIKIIRFNATFLNNNRNRNIAEELNTPADRDAIISWLINGAILYHQEGLTDTAEMRAEMDRYMAEQDTIGAFLRECTEKIIGHQEKAGDLYVKYQRFCSNNYHEHKSLREFAAVLKLNGFEQKHTRTGSVYQGIRLLDMGLL